MKRILTLLLLFSLSASLQAQHIQAYITAGTAVSQVEGDELKGFNHWGLHGGIGSYAHLDDHDTWGLSIEADYTCRGIYNRKFNELTFYNISTNLHYVDIPLTVFFHDPYGGLRIGLGLVYSRLVAQPEGTMGLRPTYFIPDTSDMSFLKNDIAPAIEFRFPLWKGLQFSARYQYSLFPIKKDWHFTFDGKTWANDCYNSSLTFRLLWQFGDQDSHSSHKRYHR